jgi:hypothetical protein
VSSLAIKQSRQCGDVGGHVGVIRSQGALADGHRLSGERLTTGVAPARVLEAAEVVVEGCDQGMVGTDAPLDGADSASISLRPVTEAALILVDDPEAVEERRGLDVIGSPVPFGQCQRLAQESLGAIVPTRQSLAVRPVS